MPKTKVFGIGFHKTATSSLAAALYTLGYSVTGYFGTHDPQIGEKILDLAFELADQFDAAQDTPWPVLYRELDQRYPGSKFILTVRPTSRWIRSVVKHFKHHRIASHEWIYGVPTAKGHEAVYMRRYEAHNRAVREYFADRPGDLLVMDITKGDGWELVCPFLDLPIPPFPFPVQNEGVQRSGQFFRRGLRYLQRRLPLERLKLGDMTAPGDACADGVRQLVHAHYASFAKAVDGAGQLSDKQFAREVPALGASLHSIFVRQLRDERRWLTRLAGGASADFPDPGTGVAEFRRAWDDTRLRVRYFAANLTEERCTDPLPGDNLPIPEAIRQLVEFGVQQLPLLHTGLQALGVTVPE